MSQIINLFEIYLWHFIYCTALLSKFPIRNFNYKIIIHIKANLVRRIIELYVPALKSHVELLVEF